MIHRTIAIPQAKGPGDRGFRLELTVRAVGIDYDQMLQYCQNSSSGTIFLEPRGSRRGGDLWQLDLQLSKGFWIGRVRLIAIASIFNVFSEEAAVSFRQNPFNRLGWGTPDEWQDPRRWEVGFRVEF